jgi:hypothetical protein
MGEKYRWSSFSRCFFAKNPIHKKWWVRGETLQLGYEDWLDLMEREMMTESAFMAQRGAEDGEGASEKAVILEFLIGFVGQFKQGGCWPIVQRCKDLAR